MITIFILHPGKANYPEILAYKEYFGSSHNVIDGTLEDYEAVTEKDKVILWCIMGFYPKKLEAKFTIHDYRSLSIGKLAKLKDSVKKYFMPKPDLRIFQNEIMNKEMNFTDGTDTILLPMGVPSYIYDIGKDEVPEVSEKFCYIGVMSYERNFNKVLDAFILSGIDGNLLLIGTPEDAIYEKYNVFDNILFMGRKPQSETLKIVKNCEYAISYFPYHRPHCFQAPTKLLEYMALGSKILCNDAPSNIREIDQHSYKKAGFTGRYIFDSLDLQSSLDTDNVVEGLSWKDVIKNSSIEDRILDVLSAS